MRDRYFRPDWRVLSALAAASFIIAGTGVAATRMTEQAARESMSPTGAPVIVVGHRGTKKFAPENTIAAFNKAIEMGARSIEMDVRTTKDGHFVIMHDPFVNRTTNGHGLVSQMTLAEIRRLDAGSWFSPEFAGERVPTLREALRAVKGRAAVDIDFKAGPENSADLIAKILDEEGFDDGSLVTVFVRAFEYRRMKPLPERYALRPHYQSARMTVEAAREDGVDIMGLRRRNFSFLAARDIADNGLALFANVMGAKDNEEGFEDALRAGARFIQTDRLDLLTAYLAERDLLADCVPSRNFGCISEAVEPSARVATAAAVQSSGALR